MQFPKNLLYILLTTLLSIACKSNIEDKPNPPKIDEEETDGFKFTEHPNFSTTNFITNTKDTSLNNSITIIFTDKDVTINNNYAHLGVTITATNNHVTVNSTNTTQEFSYILQGSTTNGSLKIYSNYAQNIFLAGTDIKNNDGPAINIQSNQKTNIFTLSTTKNRLTDNQTYNNTTNEDAKATLFSKGELVFNGSGELWIQGNNNHAICSDNYIEINSGNINLSAKINDGIHANNYFSIDGGNLDITANGDAIESKKDAVIINNGTLTLKVDNTKSTAIKSKKNTTFNNQNQTNIHIIGKASRGVKADENIIVNNGKIDILSEGNAYFDTEEQDISSSTGFKSDGNLLIENGTINIVSSGSGGKGFNIDGNLTINNGNVTVSTTGTQYLYKELETAAKAIRAKGLLTINDGNIIVKTSETEAEGIESKSTLTINGGNIHVEAFDDGLNATDHIIINGGKSYIYSIKNDAIDSNGKLTITGGTTVCIGSNMPNGALDCDLNSFKITGGLLIGIGSVNSHVTELESTQRSISYSTFRSIKANTLFHIEDPQQNTLLDFIVPLNYTNRFELLISSPNIQTNTTYSVYTGGEITGGTNYHGYITNGIYTKGTLVANINTLNKMATIYY